MQWDRDLAIKAEIVNQMKTLGGVPLDAHKKPAGFTPPKKGKE
jgi:hypothetical protein